MAVSGVGGGDGTPIAPWGRSLGSPQGRWLVARGRTRQSALGHGAPEDLLRELGLVVVLVRHRDYDLHRLLHRFAVLRHGVGEELWGTGVSGGRWHGAVQCGTPRAGTYAVLVDELPVQRLRHLHPARLLLDGEDTLGGGVRPLPRDAVEDLGVSVTVGFDLGEGDMGGGGQDPPSSVTPCPQPSGDGTSSSAPTLDPQPC